MPDFSSKNLTIPRGKILFAKFAPGTQNPGAFRELGNCPEFSLSRETTTLDHYTSQRGLRTLDEQLVITTALSGSLVTDDIKAENLAYWFQAAIKTVTTTSLTLQTQTFTNVQPGDVLQVGRSNAAPSGLRSLSSVTVVNGATTYVLNTDYEVDTTLGLVYILGGGISAGGSVDVKYSVLAGTRQQIEVGEDTIEGELKFISFNAYGTDADITVPRAKIIPNGDLSLLSSPDSPAWQTIPLTVTALKKSNGAALAYRDGRPA